MKIIITIINTSCPYILFLLNYTCSIKINIGLNFTKKLETIFQTVQNICMPKNTALYTPDMIMSVNSIHTYPSVPGKRPLPGKRPCTSFQGVNVHVAASIQTYGILIPGKRPCEPKSQVMFKRPWALTWDTTVLYMYIPVGRMGR